MKIAQSDVSVFRRTKSSLAVFKNVSGLSFVESYPDSVPDSFVETNCNKERTHDLKVCVSTKLTTKLSSSTNHQPRLENFNQFKINI